MVFLRASICVRACVCMCVRVCVRVCGGGARVEQFALVSTIIVAAIFVVRDESSRSAMP